MTKGILLLQTYKKNLLKLINSREKKAHTILKIWLALELKNGGVHYVEVTEMRGEEKLTQDWSLGKYRITVGKEDQIVSTFELYQLPHCCGICVSTASLTFRRFEGRGIATELNKLRQDIARGLGFTIILCTDCQKNVAQRRVLEKNEWEDIYQFKNKRTGNLLNISVKHL